MGEGHVLVVDTVGSGGGNRRRGARRMARSQWAMLLVAADGGLSLEM